MTKFLLAVHVLAALVAVGPVTVAASMFPAAARRAAAAGDSPADLSTVRVLHRICQVYAGVGLVVPVFGFATASAMHVLGSVWLIVSILLTAAAALLLGLVVLPSQRAVLGGLAGAGDSGGPGDPGAGPLPGHPPLADRAVVARLAMLTGLFNLLWATVTVLMIVRPGSTTGT